MEGGREKMRTENQGEKWVSLTWRSYSPQLQLFYQTCLKPHVSLPRWPDSFQGRRRRMFNFHCNNQHYVSTQMWVGKQEVRGVI